VTSAQTATFVSIVASLVILFLMVIIGIPRIARLVFLRRIEVIRDECVDTILDDRLHETPSVKSFLRLVETGARLPHLLTLPRLFALSRAMVDCGIDIDREASLPTYDDLCPEQRNIMLRLDKRMCVAYMSYLTWGSPASLVLRPLGMLMSHLLPGSAFTKAEDAVPAVARETLRETPAQPSRRGLSYSYFAGR
jgi:hypothetical protein